jgi:hypothetical protein
VSRDDAPAEKQAVEVPEAFEVCEEGGRMRFHFAAVPVHGSAEARRELNTFLGSHRVLGVERHLVADGARSIWAICVSYTDAAARMSRPSTRWRPYSGAPSVLTANRSTWRNRRRGICGRFVIAAVGITRHVVLRARLPAQQPADGEIFVEVWPMQSDPSAHQAHVLSCGSAGVQKG